MDLSKYKYFYVNGCSFTEGCGLEGPEKRDDSKMSYYEHLYNIRWKDKLDVNYATRLSQILNIPCVNDAACGAGLDRMIRTTYEFINQHWEERNEFFLILEKIDPFRSDVYYAPEKKYYIVTSTHFRDKNETHFQHATTRYYEKDLMEENDKKQNIFRNWFYNHYDVEEKYLQDERAFVGLYSFCKQAGIKVFVMSPNTIYFPDIFDKEDIVSFDGKYKDNFDDPYNWCLRNKLTITDELELTKKEKKLWDYHPGYFGHIEYAKQFAKFLGCQNNSDFLPKKNKIITGLI
jgi:hypothetical protein